MKGLIQRVSQSAVVVDGETVGQIGPGILLLLGIDRGDGSEQADRLLQRVLNYRIFDDSNGRMNHSLRDVDGGLLIVPQFTLSADTVKGLRPGFSRAAPPALGKSLFDYFLSRARAQHDCVHGGVFGAKMAVSLTNDGPVTFWLEVAASPAA